MEIDGGQTAIFETISRPHLRHPIFQESLQNESPETPVAHHSIRVFFEIRFLVS